MIAQSDSKMYWRMGTRTIIEVVAGTVSTVFLPFATFSSYGERGDPLESGRGGGAGEGESNSG